MVDVEGVRVLGRIRVPEDSAGAVFGSVFDGNLPAEEGAGADDHARSVGETSFRPR